MYIPVAVQNLCGMVLLTSAEQSIFFDCFSALHHHPAISHLTYPSLLKMESFEGAVGIDLGTTYS